jgi:hypothetical protein
VRKKRKVREERRLAGPEKMGHVMESWTEPYWRDELQNSKREQSAQKKLTGP